MNLLQTWLNDLQHTWGCLLEAETAVRPGLSQQCICVLCWHHLSHTLSSPHANSSVPLGRTCHPCSSSSDPGRAARAVLPMLPLQPIPAPWAWLSRVSPSSECCQQHRSNPSIPPCSSQLTPRGCSQGSPCSRGNAFPLALGLSLSTVP